MALIIITWVWYKMCMLECKDSFDLAKENKEVSLSKEDGVVIESKRNTKAYVGL